MAENLSIESPDFDRIRNGDPRATEDAIRLLWFVANNNERLRRAGDRRNRERLNLKVLPLAPTGNLNNVDTEGAGLVVYTGADARTITGYRAPSDDGACLLILVTGAGTITHSHQSGSSDTPNRMVFTDAADEAVTTNRALFLAYQNARWREMKWWT